RSGARMTVQLSSRDRARAEGAPERPRRSGLSDRQLALAMAAPAAVLIFVFALYPFAMAAWNSLNDVDINTGAASWTGLDNYVAIFSSPETLGSIVRSVIWTVANLVLQVVIGVAVALLLNAG